MKRRNKITRPDGSSAYIPIDLRRKLNLSYLEYVNKTQSVGVYKLPALECNTTILPDYIALYGQPCEYHKTAYTAVGFWQYDDVFDGIHGLYNAIYYHDDSLLKEYRKRFEGVRFFFTPDYSQFGDLDDLEALYRLKKARIVGLWFSIELGAVVIPFITFPTIEGVSLALQGLEQCSVVAFSTKGYVCNKTERAILTESVRMTVDALSLSTIIVYDVCGDNSAVEEIFSYATERGVKVVVPDNALKIRNTLRKEGRA